MKWTEAKVIFEADNHEMACDLISNLFYDFGLQGVCIEEPGQVRIDSAPENPSHHAVCGYFPVNALTDGKKNLLQDQLTALETSLQISCRVVFSELDEEDWAESWKEFFWPENVTENIVIKPTWREYHPKGEELVLEIDPGMAFGTGTHPSTSLCIGLLEKYIRPKNRFLDIGTGSGILMVAAARLGAAEGLGVDTDEVAVDIAEKNLRLNQIPGAAFKVRTGNLVEGIHEKFDAAAANILSEVILVLLDTIRNVLSPGSILICSGIIEENGAAVCKKLEALGFEILEIAKKEEWVAIAARHLSGTLDAVPA